MSSRETRLFSHIRNQFKDLFVPRQVVAPEVKKPPVLSDSTSTLYVFFSGDTTDALGNQVQTDLDQIREGTRRSRDVVVSALVDTLSHRGSYRVIMYDGEDIAHEYISEISFNNPQTLKDHFVWSKTYLGERKNYGAVLWGHGDIYKYLPDSDADQGFGGDSLTACSIAEGLQGEGVSFVGFDTCLGMNFNLSHCLSREKVVVQAGSSTLVPDKGLDYTAFVSSLSESAAASDVARLFVESFENDSNFLPPAWYSAYRLGEVPFIRRQIIEAVTSIDERRLRRFLRDPVTQPFREFDEKSLIDIIAFEQLMGRTALSNFRSLVARSRVVRRNSHGEHGWIVWLPYNRRRYADLDVHQAAFNLDADWMAMLRRCKNASQE